MLRAGTPSFRRLPRRPHRSSPLGLAPLVDVVLLLLIFLLVSARFDRSQVVEVELPEVSQPESELPSSGEDRIVTLSRDGTLAWNGKPIERDDLEAMLVNEPPEMRLLPIVIQGDQDATLGDGLQLLQFLRKVGYRHSVFQVREQPQ